VIGKPDSDVLGPFPTLTATLDRASSRLGSQDGSLSGLAADVKAISQDIRCERKQAHARRLSE
jgi:hypothetical protein